LVDQWPLLVVMVCLTACGILIYKACELPENLAFFLVLVFLFPVVVIWGIIWEGYQAAPENLQTSTEHKA